MARRPITISIALLLLLAGCKSAAPKSATPSTAITARTRLLSGPSAAVVVGESAVIAINPTWQLDLDTTTSGRLDDGRTIPLELYWAAPEYTNAPSNWITDFGLWSAVPEEKSTANARRGVRLIAFSPPADAIGQGLWIGSKRIELQWIPSASMLAGETNAQWTPRLDEAQRNNTALLTHISPEATNPLTRWRFKLLTEGLSPATMRSDDSASFSDPIIETWARQTEAIFRSAIRKLRKSNPANPVTADAFIHKLTQIITFPDGHLAPLWPSTDADLLGLVEDLCHQTVTPESAVATIEDWLNAQPPAAAWVRDDAAGIGTIPESTTPVIFSSLGVVNLANKPALATLHSSGTPQLARLESGAATERLISTLSSPGANLPQATVNILDWEFQRTIASIPIKLAPPGLSIGPLVPDWTMPALLRSDETSLLAVRPADIQITLTCNSQSISGLGPEALSGWTLIVISLAPATSGETFQVYFGSTTQPYGSIDLSSEGSLKTTGFGGSCQTLITKLPTGWGCQISLPRGVIDSHGLLSLGISTTRPGLGRASWPRPQFPWQTQPARVIFDTSTWGGLTSGPEFQK